MTTHSSATAHVETPHATETTTQITISDALGRRAQSVIDDIWIDPQWRSIIRYALETNDPFLADLVRRADANEMIIDTIDFSETPETTDDDFNEQTIETLAEIICCAGDEPAAALFVLMGTLENSTHPKLIANSAKHFAFTRCGELNVFGMVDVRASVETWGSPSSESVFETAFGPVQSRLEAGIHLSDIKLLLLFRRRSLIGVATAFATHKHLCFCTNNSSAHLETHSAAKRADRNADTSNLEAEIDRLVYKVYGLTENEIAVAGNASKCESY